MGSQGNFLNYNATFAENEERSPWEPFQTGHGFDADTSTVSLFLGGWYQLFGTIREDTWEERFRAMMRACDRSYRRSWRSTRSGARSSSRRASTRSPS
jgi:hypothetical protein